MKVKKFSLGMILKEAKERKIKNIFIFSHTHHDGDAKGSSLALKEYFQNKGFISDYIITSEDHCLLDIFSQVDTYTKLNIDGKFIAVIVDTPIKKKCDNELFEAAEVTYKIDHHLYGELFCDYNYIKEDISSTCEIIASLLQEDEITPSIATYLYSGIYTDTQGFKYNMTAETFEILAVLCRKNADTSINNRYLKKSSRRIKNEGKVQAYHKFYGKDVVGTILDRNDIYADKIAGNVGKLLEINAKLYFCACIDEDNVIHVNIRSAQDSNLDVAIIAKKYGGGGHFHASGFSTTSWEKVYNMISDLNSLCC